MKLSERAKELLTLIDERTSWEGDERPGKVLTSYFVPNADPMWSNALNMRVDVSSAGDASVFRSLERKGLIVPMKPNARGTERYYYRVTEDGILALNS